MGLRSRLLWKLCGINALLIALLTIAVWIAIDLLAADYFMALMQKYNISPTEVHQMFITAVHRNLVWVGALALALAGALSFMLTRKVLSPLFQMAELADRIAAGEHGRPLQVTPDEIGQVGAAFNRMVESLQRTEHLRRTMVIDVAHELRTPLTNMRGYLEALRDGVVPATRETFESLHEETLRLVELVENLLRLADAGGPRLALRLEEIELEQRLQQLLDLFRSRFAAKQIQVETVFGSGLGRVRADPDKLAQVVRNLLQNAWQYTPEGGRVRVAAQREYEQVRVRVSNSGDGIGAEDLPNVFERFYRGEKSRSRRHGGTGIGLSIVRDFVQAHGGQVGAESGSGWTEVWFTLPQ
ncbi:MAG TPA: ATP-binding protein [Acidobacteriota bacterium]